MTRVKQAASRSEQAAGNGSNLRLTSVAIAAWRLLQDDPFRQAELGVESSSPTHGSPQRLDACRCMVSMLAGWTSGVDRSTIRGARREPLQLVAQPRPFHPEIQQVMSGSFRHRSPPDIGGFGSASEVLKRLSGRFTMLMGFPQRS